MVMVKVSLPLKSSKRQFAQRVHIEGIPLHVDYSVIQESIAGMRRELFKAQYRFQLELEETPAKKKFRERVSKLGKIIRKMEQLRKMQSRL